MKTMTTSSTHSSRSASRFGSALNRIRQESGERRTKAHEHDVAASMLRSQDLLASLGFVDTVADGVVERLADLASAMPEAPRVSRRLFDGRYQVAARIDEPLINREGALDVYFTRLAFLLEPQRERGQLAIECRATVRDRDAETMRIEVAMNEAGLAQLREFIEAQVLAFAQAYFADSALTRARDAKDEDDAAEESKDWLEAALLG